MQSKTADPRGKLLVLGGTGFVGARITELALERGYEVRHPHNTHSVHGASFVLLKRRGLTVLLVSHNPMPH